MLSLGLRLLGGDKITVFKHIEIAAKTEKTNCSLTSRTNGRKLQGRSVKLCNSETWWAGCLGRQQSLHHFLTEQVSQLSLRNDITTVSPALRSGKRLYNVLKSLKATAWKRSNGQQPPLQSVRTSVAPLSPPLVFGQP